MVQLARTDFGGRGRTLFILHGLFGSAANWKSVGRSLADAAYVVAFDLRNHGASPHTETHNLDDLVADLDESIDVPRAVLMGHSMGGLAAMAFALAHPERVEALIVVDIAPKMYPPHHQNEFRALRMDLSPFHSRKEIDEAMAAFVPEPSVRQFLQMNISREGDRFRWTLNADALEGADYSSAFSREGRVYDGPTLFITGGDSRYATDEDCPLIKRLFPRAEMTVIKGAGHWLHHSHPREFEDVVRGFLARA